MSNFNILIKEKGLALVENYPQKPIKTFESAHYVSAEQEYLHGLQEYEEARESAISKAIDIHKTFEGIVKELLYRQNIDLLSKIYLWAELAGQVYPIEFDGKVEIKEMDTVEDGGGCYVAGSKTVVYFVPSLPIIEDIKGNAKKLLQALEYRGEQGAVDKDQYLQEILNKTESMKEDLVIKDIRKLVKKAMQKYCFSPYR